MTEPIHAPQKEWDAVYHAAAQVDPLACCLGELRDRVAALEAAGSVAGNPGHDSAAPAGGVTKDELADCLPAGVWHGPCGYNRPAFAGHLFNHPRLGPLLRGEGAPAPKRVVLPEEPPFWRIPYVEGPGAVDAIARAVWAAARAEVERQQGGQADG